MADGTAIEWTDATWNPVTGCSIVSPGCTNCYAMRLAGTRLKHTPSRQGLTRDTKAGPVWNGEVQLNEQWLTQPLQWRRPRRIFVCAHGDLFAENVPDEWIDKVFAVMALAPQHTFQVLTKRAARMRNYLQASRAAPVAVAALEATLVAHVRDPRSRVGEGCIVQGDLPHLKVWPLPNVWLGVSAERQNEADERIPDLLATPAAVRFVSAEPLLGPIDFTPWLMPAREIGKHLDGLRPLDDEEGQEGGQDRNGVTLPRNLPDADRLRATGADAATAPSHEAAESGLEPIHRLGRGSVDRQSCAVRATGSASPVEIALPIEQSCCVRQGGNFGRDRHRLIVDGRTDASGKALSCNLTLDRRAARPEALGKTGDSLSGGIAAADSLTPFSGSDHLRLQFVDELSTSCVDWVIVGGESGPGARPMHPDWVRSIREQCAAAGTAFFFKQWGAFAVASHENGHFDPDMSRNNAVWLHEDGVQTKPSYFRPDLGGSVGLNPIGMFNAGKKRAGRMLDGVEHNAFPQVTV